MAAVALIVPGAGAQEAPLSVIDWLSQNPDQPGATSVALPAEEPPVAGSGSRPAVDVKPLSAEATRSIGLVPARVTGLPAELWLHGNAAELSAALGDLPELRLPAAQALLFTLLLTEALPPPRDAGALTRARVAALRRFGALDPALALMEQAGVRRDPADFEVFMDLALLTGQERIACDILDNAPHLSPGLPERIFCAARLGDWSLAAVLFESGRNIGVMDPVEIAVLDRFLHPELFEGARPLRPPRAMTPLIFRLLEAIGEPQPTRSLPRAFAVADLRDLAGWKSQIEAAERLAQTGALPANRLLGLFSERQPAASGGVWDRVRAIQQIDTALSAGSAEAVAKTLPAAWAAMQDASLEIVFATLFADRLHAVPLTGRTSDLAARIALLSPGYAQAAARAPDPLTRALAAGQPGDLRARDSLEAAILEAFRSDTSAPVPASAQGSAILRALVTLETGASGDLPSLTRALSALRALGLEDSARQAALQILLLERFG
ncbi:hypothetical protein [uncultured Roseobacter sp.]|uniref:hypothetical protein n=1 Tax=uncultured Roseobacter sp. TaxID=114847 RepID=UPI00263842F6|nr:hypothetical protein [uncultured Roseobacter sp.]